MFRVDNARVVNRKYDFTLREIASCEDAEAMNIRLCYEYIDHRFGRLTPGITRRHNLAWR